MNQLPSPNRPLWRRILSGAGLAFLGFIAFPCSIVSVGAPLLSVAQRTGPWLNQVFLIGLALAVFVMLFFRQTRLFALGYIIAAITCVMLFLAICGPGNRFAP
jgi:hypothetical protein